MRFLSTSTAPAIALVILFAEGLQAAFPNSPSVALYWGQNGKGNEKRLSSYCNDDSDVILVSFLSEFHDGSLPVLNLADSCSGPVFEGTKLLHCPEVGKDIKACQKKGKKILLSLGGAVGSYGFTSDSKAEAFADTIWNIFGGGKSKTRPFDDAIIDGFDLDIEGGGSNGYVAMVKRLRSNYAKDKDKQYYVTAAPQCPFPDEMLGKVINKVGMDAVFVQFYNNYCSATSKSFNFNTWDKWAKSTSPNKNVKVFLGLPGSKQAAGSGYVPFDKLGPIIKSVHQKYSSFGGVMVWDASTAYGNKEVMPNYHTGMSKVVHSLKSTFTASASSTNSANSTSLEACLVDGQECSTNGQYSCVGDAYAVCDHNRWVISPCPANTVCSPTTDGESVYCGSGTSKNTCVKPVAKLEPPKFASLANLTRGYDIDGFFTRLSVTSFSDGKFEAILNLRRIYDFSSNDENMVAEFQVSDGIQVESVVGGNVTQVDNRVKLEVPNSIAMSRIMQIAGRAKSGISISPNEDDMLLN